MVVFSFYRGNLHRVPDIPRGWPIPKPSISVHTFKLLLEKRQQAIQAQSEEGMGDTNADTNTNTNTDISLTALDHHPSPGTETGRKRKRQETIQTDDADDDPMDCDQRPHKHLNRSDLQSTLNEEDQNDHPQLEQQAADINEEKMKRKIQLEAKLKELTEEKHHLVQMLKQILSNEEEMKKKSQMVWQSSSMHAGIQSQGDTSDGIQTRNGIRNANGDLEEGELEDLPTLCPQPYHQSHAQPGSTGSGHSRQTIEHPHQMKISMSSSTLSPHRAYGVQTHYIHIPPLATSGTQAAISSASPVGSSGTSIFREMRRASPSRSQR